MPTVWWTWTSIHKLNSSSKPNPTCLSTQPQDFFLSAFSLIKCSPESLYDFSGNSEMSNLLSENQYSIWKPMSRVVPQFAAVAMMVQSYMTIPFVWSSSSPNFFPILSSAKWTSYEGYVFWITTTQGSQTSAPEPLHQMDAVEMGRSSTQNSWNVLGGSSSCQNIPTNPEDVYVDRIHGTIRFT